MPLAYTTPTRRGPNALVADSEVLRSADGQRTANGRNMKRSLGDGRYDCVRAFNLRERVNGRLETVWMHRSEAEARALVAYEGTLNGAGSCVPLVK